MIAGMDKPKIVSPERWQAERDALLDAEEDLARAWEALAARRRALPVVRFRADHVFDTPAGERTLLDLFEGREWLVVHHFAGGGADPYLTDNVPAGGLAALAERGVSWKTVSDLPLAEIDALRDRRGWTLPFVSSRGSSFTADCGAAAGSVLSVFRLDGDEVFRTYATTGWELDRLAFAGTVLGLVGLDT